MAIFVGIDVSKATLDVALHPSKQHHVFPNSPSGHQQLRDWLQQTAPIITQIALEASGRYGEAVARFLVAQGYLVSYLNPKQIHAFARVQLHHNKTDKQDAQLIAHYCAMYRPDPWKPESALQQQLQQRSRRLKSLQKMQQQEQNRLQSGITDDFVLEQIHATIAYFQTLIDQTQQAIDDLIQQHAILKQQQQLLTTIPGIGKRTAQTLLAEINIHHFQSARQLAAYLGITPQHYQSGTSVRKRSSISKQGNANLRAALYMPAIVAKRYNLPCHALAQRLDTKHKPGKVIILAVMRKLIHQVYGVLKSGVPFDPCYEQQLPDKLPSVA
jgi:transposase